VRTALFWAITQRIVIILYRRFGTAYRSYIQGSRIQEPITTTRYVMTQKSTVFSYALEASHLQTEAVGPVIVATPKLATTCSSTRSCIPKHSRGQQLHLLALCILTGYPNDYVTSYRCWNVTYRWLGNTDVSGELIEPNRMSRNVSNYNQRCVTSKKNKYLIYVAQATWSHVQFLTACCSA
jgi:hypothetical protein